MGNKGQVTQSKVAWFLASCKASEHPIKDSLTCRPNPHDDLDDLIPDEPEEIDKPCL